MAESTRENGLTITCMVRALILGATDESMKATTWTIRSTGRVRTSGRTVDLTRAAGRMASRTGEASTSSSMGRCARESGARASAHTGRTRSGLEDNPHSSRRRQWGLRLCRRGPTHILTIPGEIVRSAATELSSRASSIKSGSKGKPAYT